MYFDESFARDIQLCSSSVFYRHMSVKVVETWNQEEESKLSCNIITS